MSGGGSGKMSKASTWTAARCMLLAPTLALVGCSEVVPRNVVAAEQRRIEDAVKPGASAQEAAQSLVALGYSCHESTVDAGTITDCTKAVQGKTELHVCLKRTES